MAAVTGENTRVIVGAMILGNATPERTGITYNAHAVQLEFHADPRPWRWFCAGYGVGKTTVGVIEAFTNAVIHHPGYVGIVAAPSFPLLMQAWFTEWCQWIPREWWQLKQDTKKGDEIQVRTPCGNVSRILLRSTSNPWANEGVNAGWLVFDEAPRERSQSAFDVLIGRLRRGYPGRQRTVVLTGPPMSKRHWTAEEFGYGPGTTNNGGKVTTREGTYKHWYNKTSAVVRARTADNPYLPAGYEEKMRNRPGATLAWCKQFMEAEFGALEGQVWSMFSREVHIVRAAQLAGRTFRHVGCGVDWGWTHPGAMIVGGADGVGNIYVTAEEVHRERPCDDTPLGWVSIGKKLAKTHRVARWYCDPSLPGNINVLARGLRTVSNCTVYAANNDVAEGIRRVTSLMEWAVQAANVTKDIIAPGDYRPASRPIIGKHRPGLYISDECTELIACLETYSRKRGKAGEVLEAPEKTGDDPADALRYLVMGLTS